MALFANGLLPASFRGVPFAVVNDSSAFGRRLAVHQYPGRDDPWAEDMGRTARRYRFRGFLVTDDKVYIGGPVQLQRLLLIAAAEKAGSGTLTHPTLGVLTVAVVSCSVGQALDAGRYSEVEFEFVEAGKQKFPSLLTGSGGLLSAATLATLSIVADVARGLILATQALGGQEALAGACTSWGAQTQALGSDATALVRLVAVLPGPFGRYGQGGYVGYLGATAAADITVADLVELAADRRAGIVSARADLSDAAGSSIGAVPQAAAALVASLAAACADPADAMRLTAQLLAFEPATDDPVTALTADMFRRLAAIELARAAAAYQPTSYDDAFATMQRVAGILDVEATIAADGGYDDTFAALRALRAAVVTDLRARGAALAPIRSFEVGAPLPSLALAQRFYRDAARSDQLVRQADPVHPLFMPTSFQALAA